MADISLKRTHALGLKGAHEAANKMADKLGERFDLKGTWSGNTLNFSRPGVNGVLAISESDMKLEVTLGFVMKMMKGPIELSVHEQLDKVLKDAATKSDAKPVAKSAVAPSKSHVAKKTPAKPPAKKK
ncbi:MAG: polyhydroxyalkanoic acid system family protein [Betaproteobacteria bacterium]